VLYGYDRHLFLQAHSAIAARRAVNLDKAAVQFVGDFRTRNAGCASRDFYYVAGLRANALHICRRQPGYGAPNVLNARFRHTQRQRGNRRRGSKFRHCAA
jgi:hypothetical protein